MGDNIILGLDPGVGSMGFVRRDAENKLLDGGVLIFPSGVQNSLTFKSVAAAYGEIKARRRHYFSRKMCKWATLSMLIEQKMCPLTIEDLDTWRKYQKGKERIYPVHVADFMAWLKLDFNGDGVPDMTMFELRDMLARNKNINLSTPVGREMLGRVVYHMALHRGFRSSKGEKITDNQEERGVEDVVDIKETEKQYAQSIQNVMDEQHLPTVGCALNYLLTKEKIRIRNSKYKLTANLNKDELKYIIETHDELGESRMMLYHLFLKTVFKVRALKGNKGNVGRCVFEKNKRRSPKSRPEFEEYRAWSFINNIRYGKENIKVELSLELKQKLYEKYFIGRAKEIFNFKDIADFLRKELCDGSIIFNYDDECVVYGCPVIYRLRKILGDDWQNSKIEINTYRKSRKGKALHKVVHTWETIWNKCYTGDEDDIEIFCAQKIGSEKYKHMLMLMKSIMKADGYARESVFAIKKINVFLRQGFVLDKAILLANIPEILGEKEWTNNKELIINEINSLYEQTKCEKIIARITNNLIKEYKILCLDEDTAFAVHDYQYLLDETDKQQVYNAVVDVIDKNDTAFERVRKGVEASYQSFFASKKRTFCVANSLREKLQIYLHEQLGCDETNIKKLYNHTETERYIPIGHEAINKNGIKVYLLGSPSSLGNNNPVVMRALYKMRNLLNYMLIEGKITNDSKLILEIANELNDKNMRRAIAWRQSVQEVENIELRKIISQILSVRNIEVSDTDVEIARLAYEQSLLLPQDSNSLNRVRKKRDTENRVIDDGVFANVNREKYIRAIVERYKLWKEQKFRCLYTGRIISLCDVLTGDGVDIEHTLPLSRSLDDSMANKTLCDADYNRRIKKNRMPAELGTDYEKVLMNLRPWEEKVEYLWKKYMFWKQRARVIVEKQAKDNAIVNMHLFRMEYDYWQGKITRFKMKKIDNNFVHRQLSDDRIIAKYMRLYLCSVFENVCVQNGAVTCAFRNMLGLESKDRNKNCLHHAEDAALLSLMPSTFMRDRMLQLYYQIKETRDDKKQKEVLQEKLNHLKRMTGLDGNVKGEIDAIVNDIFVNQIFTARTLNNTRRKYRIRGRVVPQRDQDNNILRDEYGRIKPKRWLQGDNVRGKLCNDFFYGAKKVRKKDENGKVFYVKKESFSKLSELKKLIPNIVDKGLATLIKSEIEGMKEKDFEERGVHDRAGNRIRHICCKTSNGVIPIKRRREYLSKESYKNYYYVENASNVYYAIYENETQRKIKILNLLDYAVLRKGKCISYKDDLFPKQCRFNNKVYNLKVVLEKGTRVILHRKDVGECLSSMERKVLIRRLYVIFRINSDGRIYIRRHDINRLYTKSEYCSKPDFESLLPFYILSPINLDFWVEGYDFDVMPDGEIVVRR